MSLIHDWFTRIRRKSRAKPRQSVLIFDKYQELTATQALRFSELQGAAEPGDNHKLPAMPEQPWYSLEDACERISVSQFDLLSAAADGRLNCFVYTRNAHGYWDAAPSTPVPSSVPDFLVLPPELCREIADHDTVDAKELLYHHSAHNVMRFRLKIPEQIDAGMLYLQHPLPDPETVLG